MYSRKRNDFPAQGQVNSCDLATVAVYFQQNGIRLKSLGDLVRTAIEALADAAINSGAPEITDTEQAIEILSSISLRPNVLPSTRLRRNLAENLRFDDFNNSQRNDNAPYSTPHQQAPQRSTERKLSFQNLTEEQLMQVALEAQAKVDAHQARIEAMKANATPIEETIAREEKAYAARNVPLSEEELAFRNTINQIAAQRSKVLKEHFMSLKEGPAKDLAFRKFQRMGRVPEQAYHSQEVSEALLAAASTGDWSYFEA